MKIISPMPTGNGAYIIHKLLEENISGYQVLGYNPLLTLFPPSIYCLTRNHHAQIIHTTPDYAIYVNSGKASKVLTFHGYMLDSEISSKAPFLQRLHYKTDLRWNTKKALKSARAVTAVSQYLADLVKMDLNYNKDIKVINNGVDLDRFTPDKRKTKEIKVLYAGNPRKLKGVELLPKIAAELEGTGISIYYTCGLRNINSFKPVNNLISVGKVEYEKMPKLYNDMDILLFPTLREGFGLVVAEAMACGLPVISTNCSSIPELIDDGKGGYLCSVNDYQAMVEKIKILAVSHELRDRMGEYNREKAERLYSLKSMVSNYNELYESIL